MRLQKVVYVNVRNAREPKQKENRKKTLTTRTTFDSPKKKKRKRVSRKHTPKKHSTIFATRDTRPRARNLFRGTERNGTERNETKRNGTEENSVVVHPKGSLPSPRLFPRRKWKNRVAEHVRISPPRGWSSEAARSRVPPIVAPESMTASVGLVVVAANRRESAGIALPRRGERHTELNSATRVPVFVVPSDGFRALGTSIRPARLRRQRVVPPPLRYRRPIGRLVLLATRSRDLAAARWHAAARERAATARRKRSDAEEPTRRPTDEAPRHSTEKTRQQ